MRRNTVLVTILAMLIVMTSATVVSAQMTWSGGVKGGVNIASFIGSDVDSTGLMDSRTAFIGGGFVTVGIHENFGVQLEALYAQKGGKGSEQGVDVTGKFDYFEIPILGVGMFPAGEKATVNVYAGPTFSFLTRAKISGEDMGVSVDVDVKDEVKSFDFGITFGGGVEFAVHEKVNVVVDARYNLGVTKVDDTPDDLDVKNGAIGITAGVSFPFGASGDSM